MVTFPWIGRAPVLIGVTESCNDQVTKFPPSQMLLLAVWREKSTQPF